MAAKKAKRGRGRPKGSLSRGETVPMGFRISRDLADKIEALMSRNKELKNRTLLIESLLRKGLEAESAK